jgi:hypothetical protein
VIWFVDANDRSTWGDDEAQAINTQELTEYILGIPALVRLLESEDEMFRAAFES